MKFLKWLTTCLIREFVMKIGFFVLFGFGGEEKGQILNSEIKKMKICLK